MADVGITPEAPRVGAIVLVAGASTRMGRDKATLVFDGRTFLEHCARRLAPCCETIALVLGHNAGAIEAAVRPILDAEDFAPRLAWARNPAPERGQFSSLQTGLAALGDRFDAVLVAPVDHPAFQMATVAALITAWSAARPAIVKPEYAGRRGHPVLYDRRVALALADASPEVTARDVQQQFATESLAVAVPDPGILQNLDTPDLLEQFLRQPREI